jgi:hypothetical protein
LRTPPPCQKYSNQWMNMPPNGVHERQECMRQMNVNKNDERRGGNEEPRDRSGHRSFGKQIQVRRNETSQNPAQMQPRQPRFASANSCLPGNHRSQNLVASRPHQPNKFQTTASFRPPYQLGRPSVNIHRSSVANSEFCRTSDLHQSALPRPRVPTGQNSQSEFRCAPSERASEIPTL